MLIFRTDHMHKVVKSNYSNAEKTLQILFL